MRQLREPPDLMRKVVSLAIRRRRVASRTGKSDPYCGQTLAPYSEPISRLHGPSPQLTRQVAFRSDALPTVLRMSVQMALGRWRPQKAHRHPVVPQIYEPTG